MLELNKLYLMDCMEGMAQFPDKFFDLAIVDPPYGIGIARSGKIGKSRQYVPKEWDSNIPGAEYFNELFRISKHQVIWGGNYYLDYLYATKCFFIWEKKNADRTFADCEFAWSSFDNVARVFNFHPQQIKEEKIHPTQKPIELYKWILNKCEIGMGKKLIDTHVGSGSSVIAFLDSGCDWIAFEIDKDYYEAASRRIENHKLQLKLF